MTRHRRQATPGGSAAAAATIAHHRRSRRVGAGLAALAVAAAATVTACGGGEVLAVVGFLGTGGGRYLLDENPTSPGFTFTAPCADPTACPPSLTIAIDDGTPFNTGLPNLFVDAYPVTVLNAEGSLSRCAGLKGRVDRDRVTIPGCFSGRYLSVQEIVSDDGRTVLFAPFDPVATMRVGVWEDMADPARVLRFGTSTATEGPLRLSGCEWTGSARRPFTASFAVVDFGTIVDAIVRSIGPGVPSLTYTQPDVTRIQSLTVVGGATWRGRFLGASMIELTDGTRTVTYQRRNRPDPGSC